MIPLKDKEEMINNFDPIKLYLEDNIKTSVNVIIADDYASLVKGMEQGTIDIGWYGAYSYIAADSLLDLKPLVVQERKVDGLYYQSLIITKKESDIHTIEDLKGSTFSIVDSGSTSGYVLPFALFRSRDIEIEDFFDEVHFSGTHQQVTIDIESNLVDAGAISSIQFEKLIKENKIDENDYRVIWKSEDIPGSLFVAGTNIDEKIQEKFISAMVAIHQEQPKALEEFDDSIERYIEVDNSIYHSIRNIATILGKDYMIEFFLKSE
ncbi:phosphate/phosphite/phosphonate ABC transporter binding protein [Ureibacillus acetophenoni]|uniref:Phosphate/phosphite/phosphonate ABC transporter binding protein n=1 Tax=Ureibacillus acetophenoni TaxID=614649 RepID=A0A285UFZ7_9BACL|nr:phosphate/phosphite/phosphonate ABC transporter binding protein [Ureibacillus acetophenoni]